MSQQKLYQLLCSLASAGILTALLAGSTLAASLHQSDQQQQTSTIQRIRERNNVLLAGVKYDFPPFGFEDVDGTLQGFDIDLIKAMARLWGVEVEFVKVTADARIPLLVSSEIDIVAASMTHTQGREAVIDFSQTYFVDGQSLLVRKGSPIRALIDLEGKRVGAILGTTSLQQITASAQVQEITIEILPFPEYLPAVAALKTGTIEALTSDRTVLGQFAKDNPDLEVIGTAFTQEPYGLGVQAGDSLFRHLVDATLQQMKQNGEYDAIYKKWFPSLPPYPLEVIPGKWKYTFVDSPDQVFLPKQSVVATIRHEHQFAVGVMANSPPFSFLDETNTCCIGFTIDLIKEFARRWVGDENAAKFTPITSTELTTTINLQNWGIIAISLPHTWQYEETVDFSQSYFGGFQVTPFSGRSNPTGTATLNLSLNLGIPSDDDQFRDLINFTLQAMTQDGIYQHIYNRWFPNLEPYPIEIWPGAPDDPLILEMVQGDSNLPTAEFTLPSVIVATPAPLSLTSPVSSTSAIVAKPAPGDLPRTGMSMYSYGAIPYIVLIITAWLGGSIYLKQIQQTRKKLFEVTKGGIDQPTSYRD